jgi:hypothetical protein
VDPGADPDANLSRSVRFSVLASEDHNTLWSQHKTLWVNTLPSMGGVSITANVTRFPVLVRLDASNFTGFAQVAPNRSDVRFTKSNNITPLSFEIERWDSAGGTAAVWVLLDTVYVNNSTQNIRMHWGRTGVLSASSGRAVFDTANGYRAVYHFTGTTNAVNETDVTANALVASNRSTVDVRNPGLIGLSRDFNGTNEHFRVLADPSGIFNFPANGNYTIAAWADASVAQDNRIIVSKHSQAYTLKINGAGAFEFSEYNNNAGTSTGGNPASPWALQAATAPQVAGAGWQHVVGVSSGATKQLYVNGILVATNAGTAIANFTGASTTPAVLTDTLTIGRQAEAASGYWGGDLDEVRISGLVRSADYIKLSYESQKSPQAVIHHTQPVSINGGLAARAGKPFSFKRMGDGILFQIQGAESVRARITVLDMHGRVVWTRSVQTGEGLHEVIWNGAGNGGRTVSSGIYAARVSLLDGQNRVIRVLQAKLPLTR